VLLGSQFLGEDEGTIKFAMEGFKEGDFEVGVVEGKGVDFDAIDEEIVHDELSERGLR
jgi:hypothetical protein